MTMNWFPNGPPGTSAVKSAVHRIIFLAGSESYLPGGKLIDGTKSRDAGNDPNVGVLRAGKLMGKVTSGELYRPSIIGKSTAAYVDNDTTISVSAATATEVARLKVLGGGGNLSLKFVGPPSTAGTVAATAITVSAVTIDGASSVLTISDLNLNKVTDSLIMPADGSETPLTLIPDNNYGLQVVDADGNSVATVDFPLVPISGVLIEDNIIDWPADTATQTYLRALLSTATGGKFVFESVY